MSDLFVSVVNMSIAAGWIVLAVVMLRLLLKKAPKWITVLLWGIVAVRLVCPFSVESMLSLIPSAQTVSPHVMTEQVPYIDSGVPIINDTVNPIIEETLSALPETDQAPLQRLVPFLAWAWAIGVAAMLLYTVFSYWRVRSKIGTAVLLRDNIYQSETVVSPFVLGFFTPKIYLPFAMNAKNREHVIAHECAHIGRKDHWWKPLGFLLLSLHWFNPLMWLAYVLLCRDIELACDEKVVKRWERDQKADYTQALLACSVNRRMIAACPVAFGEVGVKKRVKSVLRYRRPAIWLTATAMVVCTMSALCFLTDPPQAKQPNPEPPPTTVATTTVRATSATSRVSNTSVTATTTAITTASTTVTTLPVMTIVVTVPTASTTDATETATTETTFETTTQTTAAETVVTDTTVIRTTVAEETAPTVLPSGCHHQWGEWETVQQPDCVVEGIRVKTCLLCGETQQRTLTRTDHVESEWYLRIPPTATERGQEYTLCIGCGKIMRTRCLNVVVTQSTSQTTVVTMPTAQAPTFRYKVLEDGYASIVAYNGNDVDVVIPAQVDGYPVKEIGESVFMNKAIETVVIPDTVEVICARAFRNCTKLSFVQFGANVKSIGDEAFNGCTALHTVNLPAGVLAIGNDCFGGTTLKITFAGNAPLLGDNPFGDESVIIYSQEATGWDDVFLDVYTRLAQALFNPQ